MGEAGEIRSGGICHSAFLGKTLEFNMLYSGFRMKKGTATSLVEEIGISDEEEIIYFGGRRGG